MSCSFEELTILWEGGWESFWSAYFEEIHCYYDGCGSAQICTYLSAAVMNACSYGKQSSKLRVTSLFFSFFSFLFLMFGFLSVHISHSVMVFIIYCLTNSFHHLIIFLNFHFMCLIFGLGIKSLSFAFFRLVYGCGFCCFVYGFCWGEGEDTLILCHLTLFSFKFY